MDKYISSIEAANYLGISFKTWYNWLHQEKIIPDVVINTGRKKVFGWKKGTLKPHKTKRIKAKA